MFRKSNRPIAALRSKGMEMALWLVCVSAFVPCIYGQVASRAIKDLPLSAVRWDSDSFLGYRQVAFREGTLPTMSKIMNGNERSQFVENFRIAAGAKEGRHRGPGWNDGDTYKWLEALAFEYARTRSGELKKEMDETIRWISLAQRSDGYLHTPVLIDHRNGKAESKPFGDPVNFEMYNFGHLMTAACVHYEATGEDTLLRVAIRAADFLDLEFSKPDQELARHAVCPAHYMGIIDLYRTTGNKKYLQFAKRLLAMRDLVKGGDDNQDRVPFREQEEAVGHAVRANYLYAGAADLYLETQDTTLLDALQKCWISVQQKKIYITGGCGALYDGASPDGSDKQKQITRVHQAYGRNYQLPNTTAHNETCAAIGNVLWNYRMFKSSEECKYIDALENSLYNAVLAGVSLDGKRFFYTNTLRQLDELPTPLRWSRERQEWISCYCCPPNVARIVASSERYAYAANQNGFFVLLYGSNRLDTKTPSGARFSIRQESSYPQNGDVRLSIEHAPDEELALQFRIPGWCEHAQLFLNGQAVSVAAKSGSFAKIARVWKAGDRVELKLNMDVRLMEAHPLVEECRGQVALQRGPLVYCVESCDLPSGANLLSLTIPSETPWQVVLGEGSLKDIPLLRGDVLCSTKQSREDADGVSSSLYKPLSPREQHRHTVHLVPYFAWGNRGGTEMSVWNSVRIASQP